MLKKFFQAVDVKKGNFNKPIAMRFLKFNLKSIRQRYSQILDALLHNVHSVLPA